MLTSHDHVRHAAHYIYGVGGHDLERWVVRADEIPTREQLDALGVAADAEYHTGHLEGGKQHWTFLARRPLSAGSCSSCCKEAL